MKFNVKYLFLFCLVLVVLFPSSCKAISFNKWNKTLESVADMLQKKNFAYVRNCSDNRDNVNDYYTYSQAKKKKGFTKIKSKKEWLKTAKDSKGVYYKDYYTKTTILNTSCKGYFKESNKKKCMTDGYWQKSVSNCKTCTDLLKYENEKYKECSSELLTKYCKNIFASYNINKIDKAYVDYYNKISTKNSKIESGSACCQDYVKFALQKTGDYKSKKFHVKRSIVNDYNSCKTLQNGKYKVFIPQIGKKGGIPENSDTKKSYECYTNEVSWLRKVTEADVALSREKNEKVKLNKSDVGKRPTVKYLASKGYLKAGDIISQWDGGKEHTQVFMGYDSKKNRISAMYGVGSVYQVDTSASYLKQFGLVRYFECYKISNETGKWKRYKKWEKDEEGFKKCKETKGYKVKIMPHKFLIKNKILTMEKDTTHNNHDNPRVAAVIRLKGV